MQKKPKKRFLDIQVILASLAITSSLALWNIFAKGSRPVVNPTSAPTENPNFTYTYTPTSPATATTIATATTDPKAPVHLPVVHLLLGGSMPAPQAVVVSSGAVPPSASTGNGTGGGGTISNPPPAPPPPPVTSTQSSHP